MEKTYISEESKGPDKPTEFDLRKMVKLLEKHKPLMDKYMDLYSQYKDDLNYHYNETILALIFLFSVKPNSKYYSEYKGIKTVKSDPTRILGESEEIEETTTASSSGQYSSPKAFSKDGKPKMKSTKGWKRIDPNLDKHDQGVGAYKVAEAKKTDSIARVERIGKETQKLTNKDRKEFIAKFLEDDGSFKDYFYDMDSFDEEDVPKHRTTDEEESDIENQRGFGMESVDIDLEDEEWERRTSDQMKSPNTDLDMAKAGANRKAHRKAQLKKGYPKVVQPVSDVGKLDESDRLMYEKMQKLIDFMDR